MAMGPVDWVAEKLAAEKSVQILDRTRENFLEIRSHMTGCTFLLAVLAIKGTIKVSDVTPLFSSITSPQFVMNVPSATLWSGRAIDAIHSAGAAFGRLGDVARAAALGDVGMFRDKNMEFFINGLQQHRNVSSVSYVYENVFMAERNSGANLVVAVIDGYHLSAEHVRDARNRFGHFDIVVKSSSYGSITNEAQAAANSMGAEALTFRDLLIRLHK